LVCICRGFFCLDSFSTSFIKYLMPPIPSENTDIFILGFRGRKKSRPQSQGLKPSSPSFVHSSKYYFPISSILLSLLTTYYSAGRKETFLLYIWTLKMTRGAAWALDTQKLSHGLGLLLAAPRWPSLQTDRLSNCICLPRRKRLWIILCNRTPALWLLSAYIICE